MCPAIKPSLVHLEIRRNACRSAKSDKVSDSTVKSIDRFFDWLDGSVDAVDRVLNRHKYMEVQHQTRRNKQRRDVIDSEPESPKPKAPTASTSTAVSTASAAVAKKKTHYYILESVDPKSGRTIFVVTDGGNARAECTTRELATNILRALEKKS